MITSSAAAATPKGFMLVAYNPLDVVRLGLTAIPNAVSGASGSLLVQDKTYTHRNTVTAEEANVVVEDP